MKGKLTELQVECLTEYYIYFFQRILINRISNISLIKVYCLLDLNVFANIILRDAKNLAIKEYDIFC